MKNHILFCTLLFFSLLSKISATVDWKHQTVRYVSVSETPANSNYYIWQEEYDLGQGIHINLTPTEIVDIVVEQSNAEIAFGHLITPSASSSFLTNFEVNVNEAGFQQLYNGSAVPNHIWDCSTVFTALADYNLKVRYNIAGDNLTYIREYNIRVVPPSDGLFRDQERNSMRVWKSDKPNAKPIILATGFDAYNIKPEQFYRRAGSDLVNCLLENGYDVYVLYFKNNPQDLRRNSSVFASAVKYLSNTYFNNQQISTAGISMGGLITRYALAKAEAEENPLPVDTWISLDAPHMGANIPATFQDYLETYAEEDSFEAFALNNPAAKTLLNYNVYDPSGGIQFDFFTELNNLNGDGFPHLTQNIGVSFSTTAPNPDIGVWASISIGPFSTTYFNLTATDRLAGSFLPLLNIDSKMFLWLEIEVTQFRNPTFISHVSSLRIDGTGTNPFDVVIIPTTTGFHSVVPSSIVSPLINAIVSPIERLIQNTMITGPASFYASSVLKAGREVNPNVTFGDVIVATNSDVLFQAGENIQLAPGFRSHPLFHAKIGDMPDAACDTDGLVGGGSEEKAKLRTDNYLNKIGEASSLLQVYPNPVSDHLYLKVNEEVLNNENSKALIQIYTIQGNLMQEVEMEYGEEQVIDLSRWTVGTYLVRYEGAVGTETQKVQIQR